jgi:hypothetical protein
MGDRRLAMKTGIGCEGQQKMAIGNRRGAVAAVIACDPLPIANSLLPIAKLKKKGGSDEEAK